MIKAVSIPGKTLAAIAACLALAACSTQPSPAATPVEDVAVSDTAHPVSGLKVIPLTVTNRNTVHQFRVELADTAEEQAKGLMFRTELGPNEGMLFPSETPTVRSFWMKNTPLPLDIIFVGTDGRINNIAANTVPYSTESVTSVGLASAVLELAGGRAAELGIEPGDKVEW
ncbi:hypothetical protein HME9302_01831 [Alteripontixanthobacter maritimus]|uniref:DUF192 domain-containing protein n=1 Tax=Alteripontixanthobacter maritimus TaxID=2161824 RepID=A0A369QBK9_9SPHN|nr:DUF192 domain-containing protein [Alteripontixanthobacter maritimus]RDC60617.1 hypothetical protein HME9302_01831 [Alteripontixanthobacter maritimus]